MKLKRDKLGYTRYSRFANQVLFQLLYQRPERGFEPLCDYPTPEPGGYAPRARNPQYLRDVLTAKDWIVLAAENAAERGEPWDDEAFKDALYTRLEAEIGLKSSREAHAAREPGSDDEP